MTPTVQLTSISKAFARGASTVTVLDGVDLTVEPGEVVMIRGRSGSGKTTLLSILAGWLTADSGTLRWSPDIETRPDAWNNVAVIPQTLGLLSELTISENVSLPYRLGTAPTDGTELIGELEIAELVDRPIDGVSLGEQQRAAVARALAAHPKLLLADEPTSHLDPDRLRLVWNLLRRHAASERMSVVAASHDPDALLFADRVLDLRGGKLSAG
ncbi:MAG: ATP-binding cassette domain-containing protein [Acidimicrobiia bacterium]|nr:ATP-binding cassette domain-containing protein [Acidimicrobiia bacterium]MDH4306292.1 ATP-binding cassette domain-containing protein [Acidimicrobiia bacterium]MDH5292448.1 ATP-binding cassette domain-containing protein [Acidimicrobiia bacterium]